jgi:uncharacterized protein YdaU (DUF1376 family)
MKSKSPAFQFYPQDFLVGTAMLSAEETGAYIRLLCYSWTHDGLPDNDDQLCRLAGCGGNAIASIRHKFGICEDGKLRNARQEEVRNKQIEYKNAQKANAEKRWQKQQKTGSSIPSHVPPHIPSHIPSHDSGISQQVCQSDALHSSSSYNNTTTNVVVIGSKEPTAPENENLNSDEKPKRVAKPVDSAWIVDIKRHYPTTDVDDELRKMDSWIANNPGRRKTRKFIIGWLNRCQPELPPEPAQPAKEVPPEYDFTW